MTGGEPLAQPNCIKLLERLCDEGFEVSLETSGALDIAAVDGRVSRVVDVKTPGSQRGRAQSNRKFRLADHARPAEVRHLLPRGLRLEQGVPQEHGLSERCRLLFSPSYNQVSPTALADWILADRLPVRFQLQLHKVLWGDVPGK